MSNQNQSIINSAKAIEGLGSKDLFENMVESFEDLSLSSNLRLLKIAFEEYDYDTIKDQTLSLKGAASYIFAEKVFAICSDINDALVKKSPKKIYELYPKLIKECIILKKTISELKNKSIYIQKIDKEKSISEDYYNVPIADIYELRKGSGNDFDIVPIIDFTNLPPIKITISTRISSTKIVNLKFEKIEADISTQFVTIR